MKTCSRQRSCRALLGFPNPKSQGKGCGGAQAEGAICRFTICEINYRVLKYRKRCAVEGEAIMERTRTLPRCHCLLDIDK